MKIGNTLVLNDVHHVPHLCLSLNWCFVLVPQGYENYFGKGMEANQGVVIVGIVSRIQFSI